MDHLHLRRTEYQERVYRNRIVKNNLNSFTVTIRESDLFISTDSFLQEVAAASLLKYRSAVEAFIARCPEFRSSLVPIEFTDYAPPIVSAMVRAARTAGVGPMASVAGAIAEYVGRDLRQHSQNVIVENGGDIFIESQNDVRVGILAGSSPLTGKLSLWVRKGEMPMGVCTSSGTVGHSLSFGKADAVCIKSRSAILADAAATAVGNSVKSKRDIQRSLETGMEIGGVLGIVIIVADQLGVAGDIELADG
ncbi:MAG: UPF0280 family protein [Syntrophales bacterium]